MTFLKVINALNSHPGLMVEVEVLFLMIFLFFSFLFFKTRVNSVLEVLLTE